MKPRTSCLLLVLPKRLTMNRASLRCAPLRSIDLDKMKPPSNNRMSGLPYDCPISLFVSTPLIWKMTNGNRDVTGIGTGSKIHQMIHMMATAAVIASAVLVMAVDVFITR